MNYTGPKVRLSRRAGVALTPKAAKVMERRPQPPGQHGARISRKRPSIYALQLLEKQRLRYQYNIGERQLRNYYLRVAGKSGNTGENLLQQLETRLDALVLRAGLARTIYAARQYVRHGHITVDGGRISVPGYRVRPGQVIAVHQKSRRLDCFHQALAQTGNGAPYVEVNKAELSARLLYLPPSREIPIICELPLVIEYYSR
jgi:small subunit ribosomal protein S4